MSIRTAQEYDTEIEYVPTGLPQLERLLGRPGYPKGLMVQISGPGGFGKSTIALHAVAAA